MNLLLLMMLVFGWQVGQDEDRWAAHRALFAGDAPIAFEERIGIEVLEGGLSESAPVLVVHVERTPDGRVRLDVRDFEVFIDDRTISVVDRRNEDAFLRIPHAGRPTELLGDLFAEIPSLWLQLVLGTSGPDAPVEALHPSLLGVQACTQVDQPADSCWESDDARVILSGVLPSTLEIEVASGRWVEPGTRIKWTISSSRSTPRGTSFDPGERLRVDHLAMLAPGFIEPAATGRPAPSLSMPLLDGGRFDPAAHEGRIIVVDFWASWCGPCRAALPRLDEFASSMRERGLPVTVLTINTSERAADPEARRTLVAETRDALGFDLPVLLDEQGVAGPQWGVSALPTTIVIDPEGRIAAIHRGAGPDYLERLTDEVDRLLPTE